MFNLNTCTRPDNNRQWVVKSFIAAASQEVGRPLSLELSCPFRVAKPKIDLASKFQIPGQQRRRQSGKKRPKPSSAKIGPGICLPFGQWNMKSPQFMEQSNNLGDPHRVGEPIVFEIARKHVHSGSRHLVTEVNQISSQISLTRQVELAEHPIDDAPEKQSSDERRSGPEHWLVP